MRWKLFSVNLLVILVLLSCNGPASSTPEFEMQVTTKPERWKAGDLVEIEIRSITNTPKLAPSEARIGIPFVNHDHAEFTPELVTVKWETDSLPFLEPAKRELLIVGDFQGTEEKRSYSIYETYHIREDDEHWFSLEKNQDYLEIDTFARSDLYEQ